MSDDLTVVELLKIARRLWEMRRLETVRHIPDFRHPHRVDLVPYDGFTAICAVAPDSLCDWMCDLYETMGQDFDKAITRAEEPPYNMRWPLSHVPGDLERVV